MTKDITNTVYAELAKYSTMSLDTLDEEDSTFFKNYYGVELINATSNQAICYGNWVKHPQVILEAYNLTKAKYNSLEKSIPTTSSDLNYTQFIDQIILYAIAISGKHQLQHIKGKVMSQTRPSLSYDTDATYQYAKDIIAAYEELGVSRDNVIIKIPVTWESMAAAKKLREKDNILSLGTVVHSLEQAVVAAEARCEFIAPYVDPLNENLDPLEHVKGNILESFGYKNTETIHKYYKAYGIKTIVLIAAMIGLDTMLYCSGVDEMTISPLMMNKILNMPVPKDFEFPHLKQQYTTEEAGPKLSFIDDKEGYYKAFNADKTAVERLKFANDTFESLDKKSMTLIQNTLIEYNLIKH
ncbi:unnamed protein product [Ambrosiozyma monospora]|uniref:Unnamed protein product n=1 Tax=Ambrosiozyma monospora TaxID=43982 RepID=A0ACB5T7X9_AMBMO|nr:unnamed protein product [Ambrosiozyma monospora]